MVGDTEEHKWNGCEKFIFKVKKKQLYVTFSNTFMSIVDFTSIK